MKSTFLYTVISDLPRLCFRQLHLLAPEDQWGMLLFKLCVQKMGFSHVLSVLFLLLPHHFSPKYLLKTFNSRETAETESGKHLEPQLSLWNSMKRTFLFMIAANNGQVVRSCACEMGENLMPDSLLPLVRGGIAVRRNFAMPAWS